METQLFVQIILIGFSSGYFYAKFFALDRSVSLLLSC